MNASSVGRGDAFSAAILFRVSTFAALGVNLIDQRSQQKSSVSEADLMDQVKHISDPLRL